MIRVEGSRHGETFTVETDGLKCDHCGFETIDSEQSAEFTRLVSDEYRKCHDLLTGSEIRARRTQLGMTQQRFSEYLGTGIASVKRWESGQIQDKAMDELIRLKTDPEAARKNLKSLEKQVPESFVVFEGHDIVFALTSPHMQYMPPKPMRMDSQSIAGQEELFIDTCVAA
jgi:putative zinc finger/helix-turn-helix YgiT family protein